METTIENKIHNDKFVAIGEWEGGNDSGYISITDHIFAEQIRSKCNDILETDYGIGWSWAGSYDSDGTVYFNFLTKEVKMSGSISDYEVESNKQYFDVNFDISDEFKKLCRDEGIELITIKYLYFWGDYELDVETQFTYSNNSRMSSRYSNNDINERLTEIIENSNQLNDDVRSDIRDIEIDVHNADSFTLTFYTIGDTEVSATFKLEECL